MELDLLRGTQVRLAALNREDVPSIARWYEDAGYLRLQETGTALPKSAAQIEADLEQFDGASDTVLFGIRIVDDDALIGTIGFYQIEWSNQVAWLGMGVGIEAPGARDMEAARCQLALRYAFNELNLHRLTLTVIDYNARATALYERAGFKREGVFRKFGQRDGKRYDMYLYGLLRPEWESMGQ